MKTKIQLLFMLLAVACLSMLSCKGDEEEIQPEPLLQGNLLLTSQEAVNEAGLKGHIDIRGSLIITDSLSTGESPITDLSALASIETISGDLIVRGTGILANLDGLNGLGEIRGDITIESNQSLLNINALGGVTSFSNPVIKVNDNFILRNLEGLNQMDRVESIFISGNNRLVSLDGLQSLDGVPGWFTIKTCKPRWTSKS